MSKSRKQDTVLNILQSDLLVGLFINDIKMEYTSCVNVNACIYRQATPWTLIRKVYFCIALELYIYIYIYISCVHACVLVFKHIT